MEMVIPEKKVAVPELDEEKWVMDSSVDCEGGVPDRASTGAWKASLFIIAMEFAERMSFFGLQTNLVIYLTRVLHQDLKTAAKNVNYWGGVTKMLPLIGGFMADSYLGRYPTVVLSSIIYLLAFSLLIMSQFIPSLKPCGPTPCNRPAKQHQMVFFTAIYMISIATGGHKPSLESFGADQFDNHHPKERRKKMSFFNMWGFTLCCGLVVGVTVIVYIEDHVGWGVAFAILAMSMFIATVLFFAGRPFYRYNKPRGSPLMPMLQVLVAAVAKRNLPHPSDPGELYQGEGAPESRGKNVKPVNHTAKLRFLDKAAILEKDPRAAAEAEHGNQRKNPWRLATVAEVEATKLVIKMVPIWLTSLPIGLCNAQSTTFFVKQSAAMDRRITPRFEIPPASVAVFSALSSVVTLAAYDRLLVPALRRATGKEGGITVLQRIGVGMALSVASMAVAAVVERRRLDALPRATSVAWLVPQLAVLGVADGLTLVGLQEYFYHQVPDGMRSLGIAFFLSVLGAADFLSSFLITMADYASGRGGRSGGWFAVEINRSRLDCFFWLIAGISGVNFCAYVALTRLYYRKN